MDLLKIAAGIDQQIIGLGLMREGLLGAAPVPVSPPTAVPVPPVVVAPTPVLPPVVVPVLPPTPSTLDTLVLNLSEDAYLGDALVVIAIDGVAQGEPRTITALKALGQSQDVTLTGTFGTGVHVLSVSFPNDAYGGSPSMDRNLYLNSVKLNGVDVAGASKDFMASGSADFSFGTASVAPVPVPTPTPDPVAGAPVGTQVPL